jgi:2-polyprenyl-3-methyl-5-hydroxy-6-metoxy-1,4-benzoquinol methylase
VNDPEARDQAIAASWVANADAWTDAVRERRIPTRAAGTDHAIVDAVLRQPPGRVLDVGCGEGWLARAVAPHGYSVVGIDASAPLIDRARELGGGEFYVLSYASLTAEPRLAGGPYDAIVLNFALLSDDVAPLLGALASRLTPRGAVLVQTVHPWVAAGDQPYVDGWRLETFDAFGAAFPAPMPWYFRTLETWFAQVASAGLEVTHLAEPRHPETQRPLSLVLICAPARHFHLASRAMQTIDVIVKRFENPDEVREMAKGRFEIVRLGGLTIGRATYQPGWKWSEHVGPAVGATRCTVEHVGLVLSGAATAAFADGRVIELRAGELFYIPPDPHDSWVVGNEPYVSLHFLGAERYAR